MYKKKKKKKITHNDLFFETDQKTGIVVCCLLNVPATCECISGTDLLIQVYVLPH